jgi:E3 ubiquitin-protein ligase HECTD2
MSQNMPTPSPQPMQTPRLEAESPFDDTGQQDYFATKTIFKPLEDYIIRTFGSYECLNRAFVSGRLRLQPTTSNTSNTTRAAPRVSPTSHTQLGDAQMSEVDAKTLLLGSLGDNALWWTGEEENLEASKSRTTQSPIKQGDLVNAKSPRINWEEVTAWYKMVLLVGVDWEDYLPQNSMLANRSDIATAFAEARVHVQRTVLKASEALLRRPGRPLGEPSDARFLLILLANPLLYPTIVSPLATQIAEANPLPSIPENDTPMSPGRRKVAGVWEQGNAFGNVKRILGLLSNLSNECHRCLLAWFTRYNEPQFREMIGLIQAFVNHRLDRQHGRVRSNSNNKPAPTSMIPGLGDTSAATSAVLHSALGLKPQQKPVLNDEKYAAYCDDWQIKSAARLMSLLFSANKQFHGERTSPLDKQDQDPSSISRRNIKHQGQLLSTSDFYNLVVDRADMIADFETWEHARDKFAFCQYPFFLSVGSKIRIMEHDARRQMELQEREAFFDSIIRNRVTDRYCLLKVRRDCLADDSMKSISGAVGQGQGEIKKGLRVQFIGEEGVDAGGLRKEWFLLLAKEIFDPQYGLFIYDEDSHFCYFNPNSLENSDVYFLVGALIGLAIYNSAILDVALPPFVFKRLLATGPTSANTPQTHRAQPQCTLDDLTELRPSLARGLRRLLEYDGDVSDLGLDFVAEVDNYDRKEQIPLFSDGRVRPVTNANRQDFVNLYVRYLLETSVNKQFEPFKRGFFTVCGGNALSLFQPEEIELLVRGSDEKLDVQALKAVAVYDNWRRGKEEVTDPLKEVNLIQWFWAFFEEVDPASQRRILSFITGSDRIPAMGATSLVIKIQFAGKDYRRYPVARTCFNLIMLYKYRTKDELAVKIWRAVTESEGFGLK